MTNPHYRRCWDCSAINLHLVNYGAEVACKKCRSMDTRAFKELPPLWGHGPGIYLPKGIAKCPECGHELIAQCIEHEAETWRPVATGIELDCLSFIRDGGFEKTMHSYSQSKWQPVRDAVVKWCDARVDFRRDDRARPKLRCVKVH